MMLQLVVCISLLAACYAQDHLTCSCLKPAEIFTQPSPQTPMRGQQGPPGKLGPKGQVGSRGLKGIKGEPGISDNQQINLLQEQFQSFARQVEALRNESRVQSEISQMLINVLKKEWYISSDNYVYKLTPQTLNWQGCRQHCQSWGGDLAVHGIKTLESRRKLMEALSINSYVWVGFNDIPSEGNWVWVNGEAASSSELIWGSGEPNNANNQDCGGLFHPSALGDDGSCTVTTFGLCEKKI